MYGFLHETQERFQKNTNKINPKSENENPKPKDDKWSFQEDAVNIFLYEKSESLKKLHLLTSLNKHILIVFFTVTNYAQYFFL